MKNNTDLLTPITAELSTPNGLLYQLTDTTEKFLRNDYYTFEIDGFNMPGIDSITTTNVESCPIPEETASCSLNVPALEPLFSSAERDPSYSKFVKLDTQLVLAKRMSCDLCAEIFYSAQALRVHKRVKHISTKEFRCRKCPLSFNFESNLVIHIASHVPSCSTIKQCPVCKMAFKRVSSFQGHLRMHQTRDIFICNRCDKEFELKDYYEKHLAEAHKPKADGIIENIKAKVTNKSKNFSKNVQGKYHCQHCENKFTKPCLLKRHEVCHTGAKPFKCSQCEQAFTQKSSLDRHMLLHRGVKDFKCPKCSYIFSQKNNLIMHLQRTHPTSDDLDNMFACEFCSCMFTKLSSVNRHKATIHSDIKNSANQMEFIEDQGDDNVNVASVLEQLKSFQESMGIMDMKSTALEFSLLKPPSAGTHVSTLTVIDTIDPKKKTKITYKSHRTIACVYCDKPFKRKYDLLRHHRTHTKEKPFQCDICEKNFSTSGGLKIHSNIHSCQDEKQTKVYDCAADECCKRFSSMRALDIHTKTHTSAISYICPICSKSFTSKAEFSSHKHFLRDNEFDSVRPLLKPPIHIESSTAEEAFRVEEYFKRSHQCFLCGLKMQKLSHLRQHEATHSGEKHFKCNICFRFYTTQSSLNLHHKIHTSEKTHICEVCNAKFLTQSFLKRHMISHSQDRNFACPYCHERFKTNDNCKNHILTHARHLLASPESPPNAEGDDSVIIGIENSTNEINNPFIAMVESPQNKIFEIETLTPKKTSRKSSAQTVKKISQSCHLCSDCGKTFYKASDLERHIRTHTKEKPFHCSVCPKQFSLMSTLVQHMRTHDVQRKTFYCQVCGKKYTSQKVLTVHLRIHTGEKPFQCSVCKKVFRTSGHRISHIKAHHKKRK